MHKLHSHRFKHTLIFKILMDMHLLMLHLLEEINTQLAQGMIDFKDTLARLISTLSFHLNHIKIQIENTMQMQVVLEGNTWIKSYQSSLFVVVRLLKNPGYPIISCFIEEHKIERALLDLGASVNLLSYSVFQDRKSTRLNSSHRIASRMPSSA